MIYLCGAHPDRQSSRDRDKTDFNFVNSKHEAVLGASYSTDTDFVHPIYWIGSQPKFPDCVGETCSEIVGAAFPADSPRPSGVSIWREARRRQGEIEIIDEGTRLEYAFEGLVMRGWDPYRPGEETDDVEAGKGAAPAGDDLGDEMFAYDKRLNQNVQRFRILGVGSDILDQVVEVLRRGPTWGLGVGMFLADKFFDVVGDPNGPDDALDESFFAGDKNGHAMRPAGMRVRNGELEILLQNHWTVAWGGCRLPDGTWQPGCVWVSGKALVGANDIHALQVII